MDSSPHAETVHNFAFVPSFVNGAQGLIVHEPRLDKNGETTTFGVQK